MFSRYTRQIAKPNRIVTDRVVSWVVTMALMPTHLFMFFGKG
jgi:hypothetical protein